MICLAQAVLVWLNSAQPLPTPCPHHSPNRGAGSDKSGCWSAEPWNFCCPWNFCGGEESLGCPCVLRKLLVGKGRLSGKSPSSHRQVTESPQDAAIKSPRLHIIIQSVPKEASGPKLGRVKSHSTGRAPRRVGSDSHSTAPCPLGASSLARPTGAKFKCQAPTRSSLIQAGVSLGLIWPGRGPMPR